MSTIIFKSILGIGICVGVLTASTCKAQTVQDIYSFNGQNSFANLLYVAPAQGRDGLLYGTTVGQGGTNYGAIFALSTKGRFRPLHTFDKTNGSQPYAGLTLATGGSFFGTTFSGGSLGNGVLFRVSPNGTYTVLHEFAGGSDGAGPAAPPIVGTDGLLYGATAGNSSTPSTVYRYDRFKAIFATIYQFDSQHGVGVNGTLVQAQDGNLYGTANQGGTNNCGTIFKLTTSGTLLWFYSFPCRPTGGANPVGPLLQAGDGNIYGTTQLGGSFGVGTVFKLDQSETVSVLYDFENYSGSVPDGSNAVGGLIQATDGNFYGTTNAAGDHNQGTLFQITPAGTYKQLYSFNNKGGGIFPAGTLLQHTNGRLYGTTLEGGKFRFGVVFSLDMGLGPFAALVSYTGKVGGTAEILSQGLTGATKVTFNGIAATNFTVVSDTFMTAVVPSGATTGPVVVTTPSGTLTSNKNFVVLGAASKPLK
jgi:uncharacterized repeat protein (TIGR03803 family)